MTIYDDACAVTIDTLAKPGVILYFHQGALVAERNIGTAAPETFDSVALNPADAEWLGLS